MCIRDSLLTLDVSEQQTVDVPLRYDGYSDLDPAQPSDLYDPESSFDLLMVRPVYDESLIPEYEEQTALSAKAKSALFPLALFGASMVILTIFVGYLFWMKERASYVDDSPEDGAQEQ